MANWGKILSRGNVEDRRGMAPIITGGLSLTGLVIYLIFNLLSGRNLSLPIDILGTTDIRQETPNVNEFQGKDEYEVFASTVLGSNNDLWSAVFSQINQDYSEPRLVLFRTATESACGVASSDVGPHYCPLDQTIYLDETFFNELTDRFGAEGGDVAEAYVISHEVAHHVQNELGIMDLVIDESRKNPESSNDLSINLELQADCFAGIWSNSISDQEILSPGEIEEAMNAASSVGDDRIQKNITGRINPETWTHGSSEQRVSWFTKGYESGSFQSCNTFQ